MKVNYRTQEIKRLVKKGYTYREIGAMFGVCKQRIWQILDADKKKKQK